MKSRKNQKRSKKRSKPILFSDHFGIDKKQLKQLGIFNPILNFDTKLFVDPVLLKDSSSEILKDSITTFKQFFSDLLTILQASKEKEDLCWREARRRVDFPEYKFTCIGYGSNSIDGSGSGAELNEQILKTAKDMVDAANSNPNMFLLLPLLEEGIGPDRVSDMTQHIIDDDICRFTVEMMKELKIEGDRKYKSRSRTEYYLLRNPYSQAPIKFIPRDILSQLPLADSFGSWLVEAAAHNQELRDKVNELIGNAFHDAKKKDKKETLLQMLKTDKAFFTMVLKTLQESSFEHYDVEKDSEGLHRWLNDSKELVNLKGFQVSQPKANDLASLVFVVEEIITNFKELIEEKELWRMFWTQRGSDFKHVKELYSQMLFYMTCYSWLTAQNSDIRLDYDVDKQIKQLVFKFSLAEKYEVMVLVKHSDNYAGLEETYNKQIKFGKKEGKGFYVVMDFKEEETKQLKIIKKSHEDSCKIIEIDVAHRDENQAIFDFSTVTDEKLKDLGVIEFEGVSAFDHGYIQEKIKGGKNSYQKYKPLKNKVEEICKSELGKGGYSSARELCSGVAEIIETDHMHLLNDFLPYQQSQDEYKDWTRPSFYNWCNAVFKSYDNE